MHAPISRHVPAEQAKLFQSRKLDLERPCTQTRVTHERARVWSVLGANDEITDELRQRPGCECRRKARSVRFRPTSRLQVSQAAESLSGAADTGASDVMRLGYVHSVRKYSTQKFWFSEWVGGCGVYLEREGRNATTNSTTVLCSTKHHRRNRRWCFALPRSGRRDSTGKARAEGECQRQEIPQARTQNEQAVWPARLQSGRRDSNPRPPGPIQVRYRTALRPVYRMEPISPRSDHSWRASAVRNTPHTSPAPREQGIYTPARTRGTTSRPNNPMLFTIAS